MSSFPPNVAPNPGRNVYMPLAPAVFPGAVMVPARFPQGFPVHGDINAINRPAMGQANPPAQPASAQQGGSVLPWVLGGAAGLGALYLGYKWLSKPKAEEAAEHMEQAATEAVGDDVAKGEATLAKGAAESLSEEGSKLAKSAEELAGTVEKKAAEVVEKGVKEAPGVMSRIGNALSHRAVLIPAGLVAAAAAEYAYPVARPLARAYGPVAMEYAAKSPELLGNLFQGARQTLGNAVMNLRYSGADVCKVPAQKTLEVLTQAAPAACKPGEEPLTYLAGQHVSRLWNAGAASLSALAAKVGFTGSTAVKQSAEKFGQTAMNGTAIACESGAEKLGQCGLNDAPFLHTAQQKLYAAKDYAGDVLNNGWGQASSMLADLRGAGSTSVSSTVSSSVLPSTTSTSTVASSTDALKDIASSVSSTVSSKVLPTTTTSTSAVVSPTEVLKGAASSVSSTVSSKVLPSTSSTPTALTDILRGTSPAKKTLFT